MHSPVDARDGEKREYNKICHTYKCCDIFGDRSPVRIGIRSYIFGHVGSFSWASLNHGNCMMTQEVEDKLVAGMYGTESGANQLLLLFLIILK